MFMFIFIYFCVCYFILFTSRHIPLFSPNAGKYGLGKTLYLDTFHAVMVPIDFFHDFIYPVEIC